MAKRKNDEGAVETPEERDAEQRVFVYGTLMRGEPLHDLVRKHDAELVIMAEAPGRLFEVDGHPVLVEPDGPHQFVRGELLSCRDFGGLQRELELLHENRAPIGSAPLCVRKLVPVGMMDGHERRAWAFVCKQPPAGATPIPSGDWREHRGTRKAFLQEVVRAHCGRATSGIAHRLLADFMGSPADRKVAERKLLPLAEALGRGDFSERELAQVTGRWAVEVHLRSRS
jgi:gamma-glutamylcyclotransferase (GGCT)/AIG2-like uncharacterized protein YtfP